MLYYLVERINPEPWEAPTASVGRKKGGTYIQFHKNSGLRAYQEAVKEEFPKQNPDWQLFDAPLQLEF